MAWLFHSIVPTRIWLRMLMNKKILLCYLNYKESLWYPKVVLVKKWAHLASCHFCAWFSGKLHSSHLCLTLASFRRRGGYSGYLSTMAAASSSSAGSFDGLMNTVIKKKLGIIPKDLK